ncbi:MAG TPA: hypothetical protein VGU66_14820 [Candidatus Elarobacter sp.]|nr:hypothetical protein [Candidatus Elarobacter sp.]
MERTDGIGPSVADPDAAVTTPIALAFAFTFARDRHAAEFAAVLA